MGGYCLNQLPKGMAFVEAIEEKTLSYSLAQSNYVAAIYEALEVLPIEVVVSKCIVVEKTGIPPEVRLTLRILGEKGEVG